MHETQDGVRAWQFPGWSITQETRRVEDPAREPYRHPPDGPRGVARPEPPGSYEGTGLHDKTQADVVPIRFIRACKNGHMGDIDWDNFVHGGSHKLRLASSGSTTWAHRRAERTAGPLRLRAAAPARSARPREGEPGARALRRLPALAGPGRRIERAVRRDEPAADPDRQQRLLPPEAQRHLHARPGPGGPRRRRPAFGMATSRHVTRHRRLADRQGRAARSPRPSKASPTTR